LLIDGNSAQQYGLGNPKLFYSGMATILSLLNNEETNGGQGFICP
jgi:hypothetical protein